MLLVVLFSLAHVVAGFVLTRRFFPEAHWYDVPVVAGLIAFGTLFGLPIIVGWITGHFSLAIAGWNSALVALAAIKWAPARILPERGSLLRLSAADVLLILPVVACLIIILLFGMRLSYRYADGIGYHIHSAIRWGIDGRFVLDSFGDPNLDDYSGVAEGYANVKAVLPALILASTKRLDGTAMVQWPFLVLLLASVYAIARRLELPRWCALVAVNFTLFAPEPMLQSMEGYADVVLVACAMALVAVMLAIYHDGFSWRWVLVAGLGFAGVAGAKPVGLVLCGTLGICFLVLVWLKSTPLRCGKACSRVAGSLGAVMLIAVAIAGVWYVEGMRKHGNPLFPLEVKIGTHVLIPGKVPGDVNNKWVKLYLGKEGIHAWWGMVREDCKGPAIASWCSGLGPQTFILGIPAVILMLLLAATERSSWRSVLPVCIAFIAITLGSPTLVVPRLAMYQLPMAALAFVWVMSRLPLVHRIVPLLLLAVMLSYTVIITLPAAIYHIRPAALFVYAMTSGHTKWTMQRGFPDEFSTINYWQEAVAREGLTIGVTNNVGHIPLYFPENGKGTMVLVPRYTPRQDPEEWHWSLLEKGATHIVALQDSDEARVADQKPGLFRLLFRRGDGGAEHPWNFAHHPPAVLYEIFPRPQK